VPTRDTFVLLLLLPGSLLCMCVSLIWLRTSLAPKPDLQTMSSLLMLVRPCTFVPAKY